MKKLLTAGIAAIFSLTAMVASANAFGWDDFGDEEDAFDFAHEMAAGGYRELQEEFANGEYNPPFDDYDEDEDYDAFEEDDDE